jgi:hypothetical protein
MHKADTKAVRISQDLNDVIVSEQNCKAGVFL